MRCEEKKSGAECLCVWSWIKNDCVFKCFTFILTSSVSPVSITHTDSVLLSMSLRKIDFTQIQ